MKSIDTAIGAEEFYSLAIEQRMYTKINRLKNHLAYEFGENSLSGMKVLDVGGGNGLLTFYAAVKGAGAICLEPEFEGSSAGVIESFYKFKALLQNIKGSAAIQTRTFQQFESNERFDLIVLSNSINHLDEAAMMRLSADQLSRNTYVGYFRKMFDLLNPGGRLIITDCDRTNFFNHLQLKSPFMPSIEWEKHQSPKFWLAMLNQVGFERVSIKWSSPNSLGAVGRALLGNRMVAYFLFSHFRIEVRKPV